MAATDTTKLRHALASQLHLYYEPQADGTNVLRHIRVNSRTYKVPEDGITIDDLPADIIGTEQIKDGAILLDDLNREVKQQTQQAAQAAADAGSAATAAQQAADAAMAQARQAQQTADAVPKAGTEADIRDIVRNYGE
jgi:hypothetical protein